jgi:hypothetical protein
LYLWRDLKALFHELGPARATFVLIPVFVPIAGYFGLMFWLEWLTGWPEAYGFQCRGKCMAAMLWHSPALMTDPTLESVALFAVYWLFPGAAMIVLPNLLVRRKFKAWRQRIRPLKE